MTINWEVIIWTCITLAVLMSVIGLILYAISAKNHSGTDDRLDCGSSM
jgi:preprotein translocase subunit YajC